MIVHDKNGKLPPSNPVRLFFPLYIGDYLADTMDLDLAEHGAYLLCLMSYWRKKGPLTPEEIRSIAKTEFQRISRFFILQDSMWHHKRVDFELAKAIRNHELSVQKAMKGVQARRRLGQLPTTPS